ncbi:MAG: ATPase, T2SS/T4P/T4SS family, partial [Planctomycetota bacterium]
MSGLLLSSIVYSDYISIVKFVIVLILFYLWVLAVNWVYRDALAIGTKESLWTGVTFGAGAIGFLLLVIFPIFIVGLIIFLGTVVGSTLAYALHRDKNVMEFERILTVEYIMGLLSKEDKSKELVKSLNFITANKNEVPVPEPKTAEFYGYRATYDRLTDAMWKRTSDILFIPGSGKYDVTYNIDGVALKQPSIDNQKMEQFAGFVKNLADLDMEERRKPQKGKFKTVQE